MCVRERGCVFEGGCVCEGVCVSVVYVLIMREQIFPSIDNRNINIYSTQCFTIGAIVVHKT